MARISAADNIVIDAQPTLWRLLVNTDFVEHVQGDGILFEAVPGQPLRYTSVFASTRRLPKNGQLPVRYIERVLLGWSAQDEAWHLGFLLEPNLAEARGSRWCELVKWPDPEQDVFKELSLEAGRTLARTIGCPFNMARPKPAEVPKAAPPKALPELPLDLHDWTFGRENNGWLTFHRAKVWTRERIRRVFWYSFWTIAYIVLAVATLRSDIALPRPEWLPYLGLATAVLLIGLVVRSIMELRRQPRRIVVDPSTAQIWGVLAQGSKKPLWRMGRENIDSVYVSQVVRDRDDRSTLQYGEVNLRLTDGSFYYLINQHESEQLNGIVVGDENVRPLEQNSVQTKLQAVGVYIAQALRIPAWYDHRTR